MFCRLSNIFSFVVLIFLSIPTIAANGYLVNVLASKPDAIYQAGQKIIFKVQLLKDGKPLVGKQLSFSIRRDQAKAESGILITKSNPVNIITTLNKPGFVLCAVTFKDNKGKLTVGLGGAGVLPLKIKAGGACPADFKSFWDNKIKELKKLPMEAKLAPVEVLPEYQNKVKCYDIKINCSGKVPVSAYYALPENARPNSLPAIIFYHGAGVYSSKKVNAIANAALGRLVLDVNAHGLPNGKDRSFYQNLDKGKLHKYPFFGILDRETNYFLGMFLRACRAVQFIKKQPEWDKKTLIVYGSSQGGGQALAAAGLNSEVTLCIARVPALCDHYGIKTGRQSGWPRFIRLGEYYRKPEQKKVEESIGYFDAVNFSKYITTECVLTTGFIDLYCSPSSVYVAYNNIKAKKQIINNVNSGHANPEDTTQNIYKIIKKHIKRKQ